MRSRCKGATLIEVLVVASVFSVMLAAIVGIYLSTVRAERIIAVSSDIDRTLLAAVRHVDSSLRSSQLIKPDDYREDPQYTTLLELRALKLQPDGTPVVTAEGLPEWDVPFTISFDQGDLVRMNPNTRVLATLGPKGDVRFIRPSREMLEMEISMEKEGVQEHKSSRKATFEFRLFNQ
ncbi:MAG: type II secretion system protein [Vulcanimicrobiota bacterium]